ncbi:MAG: PDR/VanB family oxidoreductase [Burkholderiaceae bacterium]
MKALDDWLQVELLGVRNVTPTVREFRLAFRERVPAAPGSHLNVRVMIGDRPDKRSYSVVSATDDGEVSIAVKLLTESRGGSRHMWSLQPGSRLHVTRPSSGFELSRDAPQYLLLAGGIGVTPLVSMASALARRNANVRMVYATRSREEFAYLPLLQELLGARLEVFPADEGRVLDLAREVAALAVGAELYMCGPIGLMDAVRAEWLHLGLPLSKLRFETFGSSGHHAATAFTVKIPRLNMEVIVREDRSMLDALAEAGVAVLSECRRGECGLCALEIIGSDAEIDHRDVFFASAEHARNKKICACVSRAAGGTVVVEPAWRGDPDLGVTEVLPSCTPANGVQAQTECIESIANFIADAAPSARAQPRPSTPSGRP